MKFLRSRYVYKRLSKRLLAAVLDALGRLLTAPGRWAGPPWTAPARGSVKKILLLRVDQIGDVMMTLPAVSVLRENFPAARIDMLVSAEAQPLVAQSGLVDRALIFLHNWFHASSGPARMLREAGVLAKIIRANQYDLAIDFRGDVRNILLLKAAGVRHIVGYGITGGGFLLDYEGPYSFREHPVRQNIGLLRGVNISMPEEVSFKLPVSPVARREFWSRMTAVNEKTPALRVVIHPEAGYPSKQWPADYFKELIRGLRGRPGTEIVAIGVQTDFDFSDPPGTGQGLVDLRGKTSIADLPVLIESADLYIGNDSGPAHIAAACGVQVLVIFSGANDAALWHPWTDRLHLETFRVPCSPCESRVCPLGHHDCLRKITPQRVLTEANRILDAVGSAKTQPPGRRRPT